MTTITAKIICDSVSIAGKRLPTLRLRYPLVIHAECKTHRLLTEGIEAVENIGLMNDPALSRNARSSRAVPINKMIEEVRTDPFVPLYWGANRPGMQAGEELEGAARQVAIDAWMRGCEAAIAAAEACAAAGAHKQNVNRILTPYLHIDTLVSATEWENFFKLRIHADAEPHMRELAVSIKLAMDNSRPQVLEPGEWHLPYVTFDDWRAAGYFDYIEELKLISAARCARISYRPFDSDVTDPKKDLAQARKLAGDGHWSPFEHVAQADHFDNTSAELPSSWDYPEEHGNFIGFRQFRRQLSGGIS